MCFLRQEKPICNGGDRSEDSTSKADGTGNEDNINALKHSDPATRTDSTSALQTEVSNSDASANIESTSEKSLDTEVATDISNNKNVQVNSKKSSEEQPNESQINNTSTKEQSVESKESAASDSENNAAQDNSVLGVKVATDTSPEAKGIRKSSLWLKLFCEMISDEILEVIISARFASFLRSTCKRYILYIEKCLDDFFAISAIATSGGHRSK